MSMTKVIFFGSGGGRVNLIKQFRGTGGFALIHDGIFIAVDPGPKALCSISAAGLDPQLLDAIIVTHCHIDHVLEAPLLIEAMCGFMLEKKGSLMASKSVLDGDANGDRSITLYHQSMLNHILKPIAGESVELNISSKKSLIFETTPVIHDDKTGFGFSITLGGKKISYTSDTEYKSGLLDSSFKGSDLLIANNLKPESDGIPDHLHSGALIKLLDDLKPTCCIMTHMGVKMIRAGPEIEAKRIEEISGIRTIAARDLYCYDLDSKKWYSHQKKKMQDGLQTHLF
jgi:phosphoribosyl 1,2-cyclic phosphodiesterase